MPAPTSAPEIAITRDNQAITSSVRIKPGVYSVADSNGNGVLRVQADNVVIDFQGARLSGSTSNQQDTYEGIGIDVTGRKNVTIKNAKISGFKFNILATDCQNLRIEGCDLSRSRAQRISRNGQPVDVWLVLRDINAWRSYGAGLWLERCTGGRVTKVKSFAAQNGIVLIDSYKTVIHDNDLSFNSGWGIALWGSSDNTISWNMADWVNRPWSGDWGGDSAALAVVNGSHRNIIVGNSITHSGDGFFLTDRVNGGYTEASKTFTMEGASNDNLIAYNDGSWSPCNAFEGTFSTGNVYLKNRASDSRYGFWLGFSSKSTLEGNEIHGSSADAIAIEQGSQNLIRGNDILRTKEVGIHLWGDTAAHLQAVRSTNNAVVENTIDTARLAGSFEGSTDTYFARNTLLSTAMSEGFVSADRSTLSGAAQKQLDAIERVYKTKPKDFLMYRQRDYPKGVAWLRVDDFAPHDFRDDLVVWRQVNDYSVAIYRMKDLEQEYSFQMPEWVRLTQAELGSREYLAEAVEPVGGTGRLEGAGISVVRGPRSQRIDPDLVSAQWEVRWFRWEKDKLAIGDSAGWDTLFAGQPITTTSQRLIAANFSFRPPAAGVPDQYFAFEAVTKLKLAAGRYRFTALPDDGLRVFVDDKEVISAWRATPGDLTAEVPLTEGVHTIRARFMQTWGHSYLNFSLRRLP